MASQQYIDEANDHIASGITTISRAIKGDTARQHIDELFEVAQLLLAAQAKLVSLGKPSVIPETVDEMMRRLA